jgi:hypothetical protein
LTISQRGCAGIGGNHRDSFLPVPEPGDDDQYLILAADGNCALPIPPHSGGATPPCPNNAGTDKTIFFRFKQQIGFANHFIKGGQQWPLFLFNTRNASFHRKQMTTPMKCFSLFGIFCRCAPGHQPAS